MLFFFSKLFMTFSFWNMKIAVIKWILKSIVFLYI